MSLSTISHTEVDACRAQPRTWVLQRLAAQSSFRKIGYNQTLLGGIYNFHKTNSAKSAKAHLKELLANRDFKDIDRVGSLEQNLEEYIKWFKGSDSASADYRVRLKYKMGFFELRGEISRIDVLIKGGYRAVLLGDPVKNWKQQFRMPLIQSALAQKYGVPVEDFEVGVQLLDGSGLSTVSFSKRELEDTNREFRRLGDQVQILSP